MTDATAPAAHKPLFSGGYKSVVLSLLVLAYTLNFIDRTIISTIGPRIRELYEAGEGVYGLLGVHQDASGEAKAVALSFLAALGCGRPRVWPVRQLGRSWAACSRRRSPGSRSSSSRCR